jgi:succinate dehydrogenase / fumarate reductase cytochrome b subunit
MTLTETLRYRGAIGQWSWVLHRLTGLGVLLFLVLHVIDTSWSVFYPSLYEKAIAIYQSPLFTIGEFGLVACVVYHAFNGLRISIFDFKPQWWKYQRQAAFGVLGLTALTLIPTFIVMFAHVLNHYEEDVENLPLTEVIGDQLPFVVGMAAAIVAAVLLSSLFGMVVGGNGTAKKGRGSQIERFWWSYMRISGLLIVPLVFGHLAMIHILQGVFDLTAANSSVVGTGASSTLQGAGIYLGNAINDTGTAVEFVGERWSHLLAGVAIWKLYDAGLLLLVTVHGFNGLRYVLTDYTMSNPLLNRAAVYLCVIGAVVLLLVGAAALLGTIDNAAVDMAIEARARLFQ